MPSPDLKPEPCREIFLARSPIRFRSIAAPPREAGLIWLYHALRLTLACIFIYAGFIKLLEPRAFAHVIAQYDLIPDGLLPLVAVGLPALELLAGLGLIFEVRGSLTTIMVLLLIFLVILGFAVWHQLDIDCGCFTADELDAQHNLSTAFWRDLMMIGAALFLYWRRHNRAPHPLWTAKFKTRLKGE